MQTARALVCWHPYIHRGASRDGSTQTQPIANLSVRFVNERMELLQDSWPLVVAKIGTLDNEEEWIAEVQFPEEGTPRERLREGQIFEFFDCGQSIASGIFLRPE